MKNKYVPIYTCNYCGDEYPRTDLAIIQTDAVECIKTLERESLHVALHKCKIGKRKRWGFAKLSALDIGNVNGS